jgi:hypothetical protein
MKTEKLLNKYAIKLGYIDWEDLSNKNTSESLHYHTLQIIKNET